MIRLRQTLDRGRRHPILGPLLVLLLVLLLAMTFLHAAHDSHEIAIDFGGFCLGMAVVLAMLVVGRITRSAPAFTIAVHDDRGPPHPRHARPALIHAAAVRQIAVPLRR
jgi:glycerol uptake facilitator-like aquaporin